MTFGERIRALREDKDQTQEYIAKIFNTTQRKISRLETGQSNPSLVDIQQYCYHYNLSADYILGFIDTPRKLIEKNGDE